MRLTLSALVVAAGLAGFGASAQATPVSAAPLGIGSENNLVQVQMMRGERRMMRRDRMERRMMRRRMDRRMMRRRMNRM